MTTWRMRIWLSGVNLRMMMLIMVMVIRCQPSPHPHQHFTGFDFICIDNIKIWWHTYLFLAFCNFVVCNFIFCMSCLWFHHGDLMAPDRSSLPGTSSWVTSRHCRHGRRSLHKPWTWRYQIWRYQMSNILDMEISNIKYPGLGDMTCILELPLLFRGNINTGKWYK